MRLLIMDSMRRLMWFYGIAALSFALFQSFSFAPGLGFSIGVMFASGLIWNSREILSLPLSRKEIWRARWILVLVPTILGAVARLLVFGGAMAFSLKASVRPSWILLSSSYQLIFLGTLVAAFIPISYCVRSFVSQPKRILVYAALALAVLALGVVLDTQLPKQWHELTGTTILLMATGLCFTAIGFFHSPKIAARTITPIAAFGDLSGKSSRTGNADSKMRMRKGLSGLKLLVGRQILLLLLAGIAAGITSQLPLLLESLTRDGLSVRQRGLIILAANNEPATAMFFVFPSLYMAFCSLLMPEVLGIRNLRALPLTTRTLTAMFNLTPILFWLTFWASLFAAHWILAGNLPSTLRLDLLAGLIGVTCLVGSSAMQALVKAGAQFAMLFLLPCAGIALYFYEQPLSTTVTSLIGVLGLIGVAVSFLLNYRAFQRNSSLYISKFRFIGLSRPRLVSQ